MPIANSFEQDNVPLVGPRKRYNTVSDRSSTWNYHRMAGGHALDGTPPQDVGTAVGDTADPTIAAGRADYNALFHGGLFTQLRNYRLPLVIEAIDNQAGATLSTVADDDVTVLRTTLDPTKCPITLSPAETIKATAGANGGYVGFLVRIDESKIL